MTFDYELVGKIGSMALIRRGDKLFKTVPSDEKADRNR